MGSSIGRIALGIAAVAAAAVLFVVLQDGDDGGDASGTGDNSPGRTGTATNGRAAAEPEPEAPPTPLIVVKDGRPVGGVEELSFKAGERIRFRVRSNTADEIHIHGYDVARRLPPGRTVPVEFPATIEGGFEAELHGSGEQIAELRVEP